MRLLGFAGGLIVTALLTLGFAQLFSTTGGAPDPVPVAAPAAPLPLHQEGRVVALSDTSVTAVGADGQARTFLITPETTAVTPEGERHDATVLPFAVNDEVSIVGEVRNGKPFATAVAAREVADGSGPPMDYALP